MTEIFKSNRYKALLAVLCATGWSMAFPLIKLGYRTFGIASDDLGGKLLFAGIRFFLAGVLVLVFCGVKKEKLSMEKKTDLFWLLLLAVVNTTLHYMFAYIGLGNNLSGRSAILDSMGSFFLIILSTIFFVDDKLTLQKGIGCVFGVAGIVLINVEPGGRYWDNITFLGDGMILLNALCAAFGGVITRVVSRKMNIMAATGLSMAVGGGLLILSGLCAGVKTPWTVQPKGLLVLLALVLISAVCFAIYNELLTFHPISEIAIYNALIPVLGVVFAALLLREPLKWQYFLSVLLVAVGIRIVNTKLRRKSPE